MRIVSDLCVRTASRGACRRSYLRSDGGVLWGFVRGRGGGFAQAVPSRGFVWGSRTWSLRRPHRGAESHGSNFSWSGVVHARPLTDGAIEDWEGAPSRSGGRGDDLRKLHIDTIRSDLIRIRPCLFLEFF